MIIIKIEDIFVVKEERDIKFLKDRNLGLINGRDYFLSSYEVLFCMKKYKGKVYEVIKEEILDSLNVKKLKEKVKKEVIELNINDIINILNYNKYLVYEDLKNRGYIVKSGMKYGFDFRVYDKGIKEKEDHSLWLVDIINVENEDINPLDFLAKNRVAHSVRKKILLAFIDIEKEISYYEVGWKRV